MIIEVNELLKASVKAILERADAHRWSLQGLGMLRLYLTPQIRLHVWNGAFAQPNVSTLHDHPWHFSSLIVAGRVAQRRYHTSAHGGPTHKVQRLKCGVGGGLCGEPELVALIQGPLEVYAEGAAYSQRANEIHESLPVDGTVTIIRRQPTEDAEHARVFWPLDGEWVSAEPRDATGAEVRAITSYALDRFFGGQ